MNRYRPYSPPRIDPDELVRAYQQLRSLHGKAQRDNRALLEQDKRLRAALDAAHEELAQLRQERDALRNAHQALRADTAELTAALEARPEPEPEPEPSGDSDRLTRLAADFDNYRRHREQDLQRARDDGRIEVLDDLIATADLLRASVQANPDRTSSWYTGHVAILRSMDTAIAKRGVEILGEPGQPFDPRLHEAIGTTPSEHPADTVSAVQRPGYRLASGRLLRPAQVVVSAGPTAPPDPAR